MIRVLIVDDEAELTKILNKKLSKEGMEVLTAGNGKEAVALMKKKSVDVGLFDIKLPDADGVELLAKMKELQPTTEVVMMTGHGAIDTAIRSMKLGAYDYLTKPCKLAEMHNVILKAYEKKQLREKNIILEEQLHRVDVHDTLIGESKEMEQVKRIISLVASSDVPVLVLGETGCGKGLIARAIHSLSKRSANPFVTVNAGGFQEGILESELFGYKKGAFTGAVTDKTGLLEIANKGTFFVDEVADMGLTIQAKLLRVLEETVFRKLGDTKEISVDVRFIFATNKNIDDEMEATRFRRDLYYRINTFTIVVPALRDRMSDVPLLAKYFLAKHARGLKAKTISRQAMELLMTYHWPGNVRELANVLERATLLAGGRDEISIEDLPQGLTTQPVRMEGMAKKSFSPSDLRLDRMEKEHIERVLKYAEGNKSKAARLLGISRKNLYQKIEEYS